MNSNSSIEFELFNKRWKYFKEENEHFEMNQL